MARGRRGGLGSLPPGPRSPRRTIRGEDAAAGPAAPVVRDRRGPPDGGRYEYRIWPRLSHPAASILNGRWRQVAAERRTDVYLLHPASDRVLIKLRGGLRLELKTMLRRVGTVEYWTMPLSSDFPLAPSARRGLAGALGLRGGLPGTSGLTPAHLIAALPASVALLSVRKSRLLFRAGACRAEICRVAADDWTGHTVALDAPDVPAMAHALDALALGSLPNRSYGEVLAQLRGLSTAPRRLPLGDAETWLDRWTHGQG